MKDPHTIILRPVMTEKAVSGQEKLAYTFQVALDANKKEIKYAVEKIFPVKVRDVRTARVKGKFRRYKMTTGHRPDWKKAIVTLAEGYRIDIM